ncbi:MAG: UvrD-helicase domain-containing protein, partial [Candidatus Saccharimonadales bacterium]
MQKELLKDLNPEQRRAVETTEGPLLILAGAGSGKTKTLTHRIAYILASHKATPYNILAVTFTNKAAGEMRERLEQLLGRSHPSSLSGLQGSGEPRTKPYMPYGEGAVQPMTPQDTKRASGVTGFAGKQAGAARRMWMPFMGTFHSICVRILRQDGEHAGIPRNFVIWDEGDRLAAIKQVSRQVGIDEKSFPPRLLTSLISGAKNEMVTPPEYASVAGSSPAGRAASKVYPAYERILREAGALDFDDLIGRTVKLLEDQPKLRQKWQKQFTYVMIDEYQDTNAAQYKLVKLLTGLHKNIAVVGDDWQSIYSWRGADFRNILNFEKDYKGCTVIKLEQNYRSTKSILEAAHNVISKNAVRSDKKLWTAIGSGSPVQIVQVSSERSEAEAIVRRVRMAVDSRVRKYDDFAILYRTNAQSRALEEVFIHYGIPYRIVGGVRFYDRKEVKDVMSYLRLIYQPEDIASFERIVNVPPRGIGTKSLANFSSWRRTQGYGLLEGLQKVSEAVGLTPKARAGFAQLADILTSFRTQIADISPFTLIDSLVRRLDYLNYLKDGTPQGEARIENVRELL